MKRLPVRPGCGPRSRQRALPGLAALLCASAGLFCLLALSSGQAQVAGATAARPEPALVVLGDSLSAGYGIPVAQGWVALLAERLTRTGYGYHVVNASVSGETSAGALARLPHVLAVHQPAIVVIELGGNDGLRGLPVAQTQANLARIVELVQDSAATPVVVGMRVPNNYGPEYTQRFAALYPAVAGAHHAPLVPFLLANVADEDANFQPDRIHPTAAVQPRLLDAVWPVLQPLLQGAKPTARSH